MLSGRSVGAFSVWRLNRSLHDSLFSINKPSSWSQVNFPSQPVCLALYSSWFNHLRVFPKAATSHVFNSNSSFPVSYFFLLLSSFLIFFFLQCVGWTTIFVRYWTMINVQSRFQWQWLLKMYLEALIRWRALCLKAALSSSIWRVMRIEGRSCE